MVCAQLLSTLLVRAGYEPMHVRDGLTALEILEVFRPDLIFVEMHLPILSGWQFLDHMPTFLVARCLSLPCQQAYLTGKPYGQINQK
jgi:CheY-like chemotaxis protein